MANARATSLWDRVDERRARRAPTGAWSRPGRAAGRRFRWVVDAMLPLSLSLAAGVAVLLPKELPADARLSLFGFALAVVLWSTTKLNAAYVALAAVMMLVLSGGVPQEHLFGALASDVIWLMIGAFVLGGAVQKTGLAGRLTGLVVSRARSVGGVFWMVTTVLVPLSLVIPSTSGRAAVVMPVFKSIVGAADDKRVTRALALLMPTVILVSTIATLIGAGSHLIANDLLAGVAGERVSFARWALWGAPFALAASYVSCWVIGRMFLDGDRRGAELRVADKDRGPLSRAEWTTLAVVALMVAMWLTEALHGLEIATVTVAGAMLLTLPFGGVLKWKDALRSVSWNLIIFVGAALVLGEALIETGAARWIIDGIFAVSGIRGVESPMLILLILSFISLTSHVYMTSHAARAAALVPPLLYLANVLKLDPVAVMFIGTVGMDYCQTLPVSSKALLMFQDVDGSETFEPADLLRLSSVLLIAHLVLMVLFYYGYWQWVGLSF